jgi:hypothetical protein
VKNFTQHANNLTFHSGGVGGVVSDSGEFNRTIMPVYCWSSGRLLIAFFMVSALFVLGFVNLNRVYLVEFL